MENNLVELGLIPLVTAVIQAIKKGLSKPARDRWTTLIAMGCGVAAVLVWRLANGVPIAGSQAIADAILRGLATGLSAVGFYHVLGDVKGQKK